MISSFQDTDFQRQQTTQYLKILLRVVSVIGILNSIYFFINLAFSQFTYFFYLIQLGTYICTLIYSIRTYEIHLGTVSFCLLIVGSIVTLFVIGYYYTYETYNYASHWKIILWSIYIGVLGSLASWATIKLVYISKSIIFENANAMKNPGVIQVSKKKNFIDL